MPLFMDRHDIGAATAEELAEAHKRDIAIQDRHNCRTITYWHDEARGTAFCLIAAPSAEAVRGMRRRLDPSRASGMAVADTI